MRKPIAQRFAEFIANRIKKYPNAPVCNFYIANKWLSDQSENSKTFSLAEIEGIFPDIIEKAYYAGVQAYTKISAQEPSAYYEPTLEECKKLLVKKLQGDV